MSLELRIPVVRAGEPAMHHTHHAGSAGPSLDGPFRSDLARSFFRLGRKTMGRIPVLDRGDRFHARTEVTHGGAANALVAGAGDEPRRDAFACRNGPPDFLGRAGNFDLSLDGPPAGRVFFHRHDKLP